MSGAPAPGGIVAAAARALALIEDGARVGLGTGRAAGAFVAGLAERARAGLSVTCVATSEATARQAQAAGLRVVELDEAGALDVTVDGADEVAPNLDLVKGRGGAFVRERIVAAAARRQVIVVGPEKLVEALGETGPIPLEVIPMALGLCTRRLDALGMRSALRVTADGQRFISDNGNLVVDVAPAAPLSDPGGARAFAAALRAIPGVVDTGLFLGTAEIVLVGHPDGRVDTRRRTR
jgi:ribose 5-phosphate isomerase A